MAGNKKTVPELPAQHVAYDQKTQPLPHELSAREIPGTVALAIAGLVDGSMPIGVAALMIKGCAVAVKAIALAQLGG